MINKIDDIKIKDSIQTVEDLLNDSDSCYTLLKLIQSYREVINSTVDVANQSAEYIEWLKTVGLNENLVTILSEWLADGTLENLINIEMLDKKAEFSVVNDIPVGYKPNQYFLQIIDGYKVKLVNNGLTYYVQSRTDNVFNSENKSVDDLITELKNSINNNNNSLQNLQNEVDEFVAGQNVLNDSMQMQITDNLNNFNNYMTVDEIKDYVKEDIYFFDENIPTFTKNDFFELKYSTLINNIDTIINNDSRFTKNSLGLDSSGMNVIYEYVFAPSTGYNKTILITSGVHGDEKFYPYMLQYFFKLLKGEFNCKSILNDIILNTRLVIIPVVNTYGYNERTRKNYNFVDLNRNFDYKWNEQDSDCNNQSSVQYKGTAPFSEVESVYVRDCMKRYRPNACIDLHNFGAVDVQQDYCMYYSVFSEKLTKEIISKIKKENEIATFYLQGQDSCLANYYESIYRKPSMTLEFLWNNSITGSKENIEKSMNLFLNHLIKFNVYKENADSENYIGKMRVDNISYESSAGIDIPYSSNLIHNELFDKTLSYNRNGVLLVNGSITYKCLGTSGVDKTTSNSISLNAEILKNGTSITERQGATYSSGSWSDVLPFNLIVPITASDVYKFQVSMCFDGNSTYVPKLSRCKVTFLFIGE